MKVLITGATGLVGGKITEVLHADGHEVHYLTTRKEAIENKANYKGFLWDVKAMTIDSKCIDGVDTIIHLAGESVFQRWTDEAKERIMSSRIDSTQLLLNLLEDNEHQVKHAITASAIGIYPDQKEGPAMQENEVPPMADNFLADVCVAWESIGMQFQGLGVKHSIVRIGIVLASKGGALEQMAKPVKMYAGAGFGDGRMWQSWIAVDDLAQIFVHIASHKLTGVYNGVAPNPVRNRAMMEKIGNVVNKPVFLPNVPKFMMKLIMGEMSTIILASQHVSSNKIQEAGYSFDFTKLEAALEEYLD
ncbi:TIGR01777 family oxidoreductase [Nonlabens ponticola]|uniref:TIGR01777 family protein n=1 Tax=Nonlabens ponticola TaxID=2496866 RepID=A0A3S9MZT1_9FLAO|nr:TIGR01777 family oxidoreductase [Nonlabens ponticola]AZQ44751.1 TIGR01777 family protein [Nonlabens ponticola]